MVKNGVLALKYGVLVLKYGALPIKYGALPIKYGALPIKYGVLPIKCGALSIKYGVLPIKYGVLKRKNASFERNNDFLAVFPFFMDRWHEKSALTGKKNLHTTMGNVWGFWVTWGGERGDSERRACRWVFQLMSGDFGS